MTKAGGGQVAIMAERNRILEEQVSALSHQVTALQKSRDVQVGPASVFDASGAVNLRLDCMRCKRAQWGGGRRTQASLTPSWRFVGAALKWLDAPRRKAAHLLSPPITGP